MHPLLTADLATTRRDDLLRAAEAHRRTHRRQSSRSTRSAGLTARSSAKALVRRLSLTSRELLGLGRTAEPAPCC